MWTLWSSKAELKVCPTLFHIAPLSLPPSSQIKAAAAALFDHSEARNFEFPARNNSA